MSETPKKKTSPRKTAAKTTATPSTKPSYVPPAHHEVELLAYQLWVDRGKHHGEDARDWLAAEEQLKTK